MLTNIFSFSLLSLLFRPLLSGCQVHSARRVALCACELVITMMMMVARTVMCLQFLHPWVVALTGQCKTLRSSWTAENHARCVHCGQTGRKTKLKHLRRGAPDQSRPLKRRRTSEVLAEIETAVTETPRQTLSVLRRESPLEMSRSITSISISSLVIIVIIIIIVHVHFLISHGISMFSFFFTSYAMFVSSQPAVDPKTVQDQRVQLRNVFFDILEDFVP